MKIQHTSRSQKVLHFPSNRYDAGNPKHYISSFFLKGMQIIKQYIFLAINLARICERVTMVLKFNFLK